MKKFTVFMDSIRLLTQSLTTNGIILKLFVLVFFTFSLLVTYTHTMKHNNQTDAIDISDLSSGIPINGISDDLLDRLVVDDKGDKTIVQEEKEEEPDNDEEDKPEQVKKPRGYAQYIRSDKSKEIFTCKICHAKFNHYQNCIRHVNMKHLHKEPKETFVCKICHKQFSRNSDLVNHNLTHTGEQPFACMICNKRFSLQTNCTKHLITHTNYKAFACKICLKKFKRKYDLKKHGLTHMKKEDRRKLKLQDSLK